MQQDNVIIYGRLKKKYFFRQLVQQVAKPHLVQNYYSYMDHQVLFRRKFRGSMSRLFLRQQRQTF
jgi:hypothetical protein